MSHVSDINVLESYIFMLLVGLKKYVSDSVFFSWITALIPSPVGDLENALGHPGVPSGRSRGRSEALRASLRPLLRPSGTPGCPRAFSRSPPGSGDQSGDPLKKTRITYTYIFKKPKFTIQTFTIHDKFSFSRSVLLINSQNLKRSIENYTIIQNIFL